MPAWVDIIIKLTPAFFTLVVGLTAGTIAYLQYKLNHDKLRLDLFSKRLEAYETLQKFYTSVLREGCVKDDALPTLAEARYKSQFIFGSEIEAHFDGLWKKAVDMHTLHSKLYKLGTLPVGPERTAVCDEEHKLLIWMMDVEMKEAPKRYTRYLQFK